MRCLFVPHALCGFVLVVAVELRRSQHGLGEHSQEAQGLHEQRRVQEEVGDVGCQQSESQHTLQVVHKAAPRPEVIPVKVYNTHIRKTQMNGNSSIARTQPFHSWPSPSN